MSLYKFPMRRGEAWSSAAVDRRPPLNTRPAPVQSSGRVKPGGARGAEAQPMTTRDRDDRLLRIGQVVDLVGFKKSKVYAMAAAGRFPCQRRIGGVAVWSEREVQAWIALQCGPSRVVHR